MAMENQTFTEIEKECNFIDDLLMHLLNPEKILITKEHVNLLLREKKRRVSYIEKNRPQIRF